MWGGAHNPTSGRIVPLANQRRVFPAISLHLTLPRLYQRLPLGPVWHALVSTALGLPLQRRYGTATTPLLRRHGTHASVRDAMPAAKYARPPMSDNVVIVVGG